TVSSIVDEWVEGTGTSYDRSPGVGSFLWAENAAPKWSGDGLEITGVTLGNGGSILGFADASHPLLPGAMRGHGASGLKKRIPGSQLGFK
ncbi:MAG: hypothetical protein KDN20_25370, partial [Verrucomicrobiae bacterium]|nr:hypothetical protein [Verrucomicrobiae bacterium]